MAMDRTVATAKAMSTTTAIAWTSVATAATSTVAANSRERQGRGVSKVGQQTQQSDRVYLRDLQLRRLHLVRAPTANRRPAASAVAEFAWDIWTGRHRRVASKVGQKYNNQTALTLPRPQPTHERGRVSGAPQPSNQQPAAPAFAALASSLVGREGHEQSVSKASWQKHSNNKELIILAWLR